ncbi:MAG: hypothetical protein JXB38_22635 [Anaerolineales bacterium]|nr:hypothetical protein [Anaerolineales bacterium]
MQKKLWRKLIMIGVGCALLFTACDAPANENPNLQLTAAAQTIEAQLTLTPRPTATRTPTAEAAVDGSATPEFDTASGEPCDLAGFVADVTIPDGTEVQSGAVFTKTWRVRNDGTCVWNSGYSLVFVEGFQMDGPESQRLTSSTIPPGGSVDLSLDLVAPDETGIYLGGWMLENGDGERFGLQYGEAFYVEIKVVPGPTPTDTVVPVTPPATATTGPQPDLVVTGFSLEPISPRQGEAVKVVALVENQGAVAAAAFQVAWWAEQDLPTPTCTWDIALLQPGENQVLTCTYAGYPQPDAELETIVVADALNDLAEVNENNNLAKITIQVLAP